MLSSHSTAAREVISWVAADKHLVGADARDLIAQSIEAHFEATQTPHPIERLSDNGPQFTAHETRHFGAQSGLAVRDTLSYLPESNGMADAFVKTFKRNSGYLADVCDAETVMKQLLRRSWQRDQTTVFRGGRLQRSRY